MDVHRFRAFPGIFGCFRALFGQTGTNGKFILYRSSRHHCLFDSFLDPRVSQQAAQAAKQKVSVSLSQSTGSNAQIVLKALH